MIPSNSRVYLETSAVNKMAEYHLAQDGKATQLYHAKKGTHFFVSPVTIWEILLTNDSGRREGLIYYLQHLGDERLLKSPAEMIIGYIKAGCPKQWSEVDMSSTLPLAKIWRNLCRDNRQTFIYNPEDFQRNAASQGPAQLEIPVRGNLYLVMQMPSETALN